VTRTGAQSFERSRGAELLVSRRESAPPPSADARPTRGLTRRSRRSSVHRGDAGDRRIGPSQTDRGYGRAIAWCATRDRAQRRTQAGGAPNRREQIQLAVYARRDELDILAPGAATFVAHSCSRHDPGLFGGCSPGDPVRDLRALLPARAASSSCSVGPRSDSSTAQSILLVGAGALPTARRSRDDQLAGTS
jgi:hypothetical protein